MCSTGNEQTTRVDQLGWRVTIDHPAPVVTIKGPCGEEKCLTMAQAARLYRALWAALVTVDYEAPVVMIKGPCGEEKCLTMAQAARLYRALWAALYPEQNGA